MIAILGQGNGLVSDVIHAAYYLRLVAVEVTTLGCRRCGIPRPAEAGTTNPDADPKTKTSTRMICKWALSANEPAMVGKLQSCSSSSSSFVLDFLLGGFSANRILSNEFFGRNIWGRNMGTCTKA